MDAILSGKLSFYKGTSFSRKHGVIYTGLFNLYQVLKDFANFKSHVYVHYNIAFFQRNSLKLKKQVSHLVGPIFEPNMCVGLAKRTEFVIGSSNLHRYKKNSLCLREISSSFRLLFIIIFKYFISLHPPRHLERLIIFPSIHNIYTLHACFCSYSSRLNF